MKKQFLTILLTFNLLSLLNACECPSEKYFDYRSLSIATNPTVPLNESLLIKVSLEDIYYLTQNKPLFQFGTAAYATTVCGKGYQGEKYSRISISIKSDSNFDALHPAGTELGDLVKVYGIDSNGEYRLGYLNEFQAQTVNPGYFFIESRPIADNSHIFTIEFKKSNDDIVTGISREVIWE